jgi:hypothetical protein
MPLATRPNLRPPNDRGKSFFFFFFFFYVRKCIYASNCPGGVGMWGYAARAATTH